MSFITMKPGTLLSPTPVIMLTCAAETARPNIITLAWVGTVNSEPPMVSVSIRESRHSHKMVLDSGEFVINLVSRELMKATDYCGVVSGRDIDKFEACGLSAVAAEGMERTPAIAQSPGYLACKLRHTLELGTHTMMVGEVVGVGIREDLMDKSGKADFARADLVAYCHGEYMGLRQPEGFFGFSIAREEVLKRLLKKK